VKIGVHYWKNVTYSKSLLCTQGKPWNIKLIIGNYY
jgi:hypothetical protein